MVALFGPWIWLLGFKKEPELVPLFCGVVDPWPPHQIEPLAPGAKPDLEGMVRSLNKHIGWTTNLVRPEKLGFQGVYRRASTAGRHALGKSQCKS